MHDIDFGVPDFDFRVPDVDVGVPDFDFETGVAAVAMGCPILISVCQIFISVWPMLILVCPVLISEMVLQLLLWDAGLNRGSFTFIYIWSGVICLFPALVYPHDPNHHLFLLGLGVWISPKACRSAH